MRELRRAIAREREVPAFVIFGDATLRDLARRRPSTVDALTHVYGVGAKKCEDLGARFVETVIEYCEERGIDVDCVAAPPTRARAAGGGRRVTGDGWPALQPSEADEQAWAHD